MEDIPPSYDNIDANVLDLLPPYLSTASLVNLCLVSKAHYATFAPHLWGSPASHFVQVADENSRTTNGINFANLQVSGSQNDMVYVALTRFKRVLRKARLSTRLLCHTLHLPPALSEIYGGPNSTWLRDVLDWLPALQSLCVSGLPFFDHESLVAVDQSRNASSPVNLNDDNFRRYPVKLLLAAKEPNVTWVGLSLLLPHLPSLVYLDLSYTSPARNVTVLQSLDALTHLQILKLRGIGLRDNELEVLANVIGLRVRLLDIAENQLSDTAVRSLLQACVWLPTSQSSNLNINMPNDQYSRRHLESWPVGLPPPPDSLSLDTIRTVELDEALLNQLTHPLTGRLAFEDIPHGGITHLYLSGNPGITIESIRSILDIGRLHVLDAGDIGALTALDLQVLAAKTSSGSSKDAARARAISTANMNIRGFIHRHKSRPSSVHSFESGQRSEDQAADLEELLKMPGAEKLVPVLQEKASKNLTHLRIDHAVATAVLDIAKELKEKDKKIANFVELPGELSKAVELDATNRELHEAAASKSYATEMPAGNAIFEMDATPAPQRAELPGDIIHFALSPPIGHKPQQSSEEVMTPVRGDGAMAPEVVGQRNTESNVQEEDNDIVLDATGSGIRRKATSATSSTVSTLRSEISAPSQTSSIERPAPLQIRRGLGISSRESLQASTHQAEILNLLGLRPKGLATKLHPSFLPNLRTLVLTNLPSQVPASSSIIDNLKAFISACAAETRLATLKARTNYSLPPGRARQDAERQHARTLFALRTIVLEISPEIEQGPQRGWRNTWQRPDVSKSSTGDRDSEAFWAAAENDFSFFGEEGEEAAECGIYEQEPDKYYPTIPFNDEKVVLSGTDYSGDPSSPHRRSTLRISSPTGAYSSGGALSPMSPIMRNGTVLQSPRNLPLGRNRRTSNDMQRGPNSPPISEYRPPSRAGVIPPHYEMPGTIPTSRPLPPTSNPAQPAPTTPTMLDIVTELAKWRRERKAAYEKEVVNRLRRASSSSLSGRLADAEVYVEGYWSGEVKVVRNMKKVANGKLERKGNVDIYGNYFEGGYLYP